MKAVWVVVVMFAAVGAQKAQAQACNSGDGNVAGQCVYGAIQQCRGTDAVAVSQPLGQGMQISVGPQMVIGYPKVLVCTYAPGHAFAPYTACLAGETPTTRPGSGGGYPTAMCAYPAVSVPTMVSVGCNTGQQILPDGRCQSTTPRGVACPAGVLDMGLSPSGAGEVCVNVPAKVERSVARSCNVYLEMPAGPERCMVPASAARAQCKMGEQAYDNGQCAYPMPPAGSSVTVKQSVGCRQGEQILGDGSCVYALVQPTPPVVPPITCGNNVAYGDGRCRYTPQTVDALVPGGSCPAGSTQFGYAGMTGPYAAVCAYTPKP